MGAPSPGMGMGGFEEGHHHPTSVSSYRYEGEVCHTHVQFKPSHATRHRPPSLFSFAEDSTCANNSSRFPFLYLVFQKAGGWIESGWGAGRWIGIESRLEDEIYCKTCRARDFLSHHVDADTCYCYEHKLRTRCPDPT